VVIWNRPGTGAPVDLHHKSEVRGLAWSPDGRRLAVADDNKGSAVHVWDVESRRELGRLSHSKVTAIAWGDGVIVSGGRDKIARLWDANGLREIARFEHPNPVLAVAVTADGKQIATSDESKAVHIWSAESARELMRLPNDDRVDALAWSPDGQRLACAYTDNNPGIRIWEVSRAKQQVVKVTHQTLTRQYPVNALAWTRDGKYLASGGNDRIARVWDVETRPEKEGKPVELIELARLPHGDNLRDGISWSPDGRLLATGGGSDHFVRVWEAGAGEGGRLVLGGKVEAEATSADGRLIASASGDGREHTVRSWEWDGERGSELFQVKSRDRVDALALSSDARLLAAGTLDGQVLIMEARTGRERFRLDHGGPVLAIAWAPDGQRLVTAGDRSKPILVWDLSTRRPVEASMHHDPKVWDVAWSPDGRSIASVGDDPSVWVWNVATGRGVPRGKHGKPVKSLAWSPDSQRLATGSDDRTARIWDATTGTELKKFEHASGATLLTWSDKGKWLVTASAGAAHVWNAGSGEEISRLSLPGNARGGVFSPDAGTLTTVSRFGDTLLVIDHALGPEALLAATCARLTRNLTESEWKEYVGGEVYRKTCPNLP
jgi:WD40 repeat protein